MNFAELQAEVFIITNRPDLVADTQLAIRKATSKLHAIDYFPKDLVEIPLVIPVPSANVQIDTNANFPRMRSIAYLRDSTSLTSTSLYNKLFEQINPRALLDDYQMEKTNCWYLGGQVINLKSSTAVSSLLVGYYENPVITPIGAYSSWIAVEQPYAIIEEAAATVFRMTGNAEMARFYEQQSAQNVMLLRQNYLEETAR